MGVKKNSVVGFRAAASLVSFNSMGTGPAVNAIDGGTTKIVDGADDPEIIALIGEGDLVITLSFTSGSGTPAIAANNVVITLPSGVNPRKVFLSGGHVGTPKWFINSISNNVINIGTKVAPAASTAYGPFELICVM